MGGSEISIQLKFVGDLNLFVYICSNVTKDKSISHAVKGLKATLLLEPEHLLPPKTSKFPKIESSCYIKRNLKRFWN